MHVMILIHYSYESLWNRCFSAFILKMKCQVVILTVQLSSLHVYVTLSSPNFTMNYNPSRYQEDSQQTEWDSINFELLHLNIQMDTLDEIKPACFYCNQSCSWPDGRHNTRKHKQSGRLWSYVQMPDEHDSICSRERTWGDQTWRESPALE